MKYLSHLLYHLGVITNKLLNVPTWFPQCYSTVVYDLYCFFMYSSIAVQDKYGDGPWLIIDNCFREKDEC